MNRLLKFIELKRVMAFTLAETLIVMGIIGVVAALTLPNLNSSTGEKEKIAKVKKIYQELTDALGRAEAVYGPYNEWYINDTGWKAKGTRVGERLTEFMKLSKNCKTTKGCYERGSGDSGDGGYYQFILADGTAVGINYAQYSFGIIMIDIDGSNKGSNLTGNDVFAFYINYEKNRVEPYRGPNADSYDSFTFSKYESNLIPGGPRLYASSWIIDYDNMDYLKLDSNGKCPNGTTPTESNPRCK